MTETRRKLTETQLAEEQLLVQAAQKDPKKFGLLYERYYRSIFLFIFKRTGAEEVAADVTSQVFLKAMLKLSQYRFQGVPFSAWLFRIAINEVNQHYRQSKNQRVVSVEHFKLGELIDEVEEDRTDQNIQHMIHALDSLSEDELMMVELRYFEKVPFKEIAQLMRITENNAKVRMYRILGRLRKRMNVPQEKALKK